MRDRHDQPLVPEHLDGSPRRVAGDTEQVNKIFLRGQWVLVRPELARFDPGAQPCRDLAVWRYCTTPVDLRHIHDHKLADQQQRPTLAYLAVFAAVILTASPGPRRAARTRQRPRPALAALLSPTPTTPRILTGSRRRNWPPGPPAPARSAPCLIRTPARRAERRACSCRMRPGATPCLLDARARQQAPGIGA